MSNNTDDVEIVPPDRDDGDETIERVASLDWQALAVLSPPPRQWVLRHWISMGTTTLLAGQAGIGKTLLAQTLSTALALRRDYIDDVPQARRVLFWAGEDDHDELWRRQLTICKPFDITLADLPDALQIKSYQSHDITLAALVFGRLSPTRMLKELREQVGDYRAEVVMLDSIARIFGGNENDRNQVTTFLAWLMHALAGASLVLIGHPGKASGAEFSGSTAWEASVRARLYFGAICRARRSRRATTKPRATTRSATCAGAKRTTPRPTGAG